MSDIQTKLHPSLNPDDTLYPDVIEDNIPESIQRKLTAGTGITINNNVISATSGTASYITDDIGTLKVNGQIKNNNRLAVSYTNATYRPISNVSDYYIPMFSSADSIMNSTGAHRIAYVTSSNGNGYLAGDDLYDYVVMLTSTDGGIFITLHYLSNINVGTISSLEDVEKSLQHNAFTIQTSGVAHFNNSYYIITSVSTGDKGTFSSGGCLGYDITNSYSIEDPIDISTDCPDVFGFSIKKL